MDKPIKKNGETAKAFAARMTAWQAAQAKSASASQSETSDEAKTFKGTVISVDPVLKTKSNGNTYRTAKIELEEVFHPKTGDPAVIAAMRTILKVADENGDAIPEEDQVESNMVEVGQSVTVYGRVVTNEDGDKVMHFDISTGSTDNSDEDLIEAMFGA